MEDGDPQECDDDRTIELSSLAAIYPELVIHSVGDSKKDERRASLQIQVEPLKPLRIKPPSLQNGISVLEEGQTIHEDDESRNIHVISSLPPLTVDLTLPPNYPSEQPPTVHLVAQESWLAEHKLEELKNASHKLWEDFGRDQILYSYLDYVREAAEDAFGIRDTLEVSPDLKVVLLDYDLKARRAKFEKGTFDCGVCLEPKKGTVCHRLSLCSHVFCLECLQDFYNNCITEGDVNSIKCLAPKCPEEPESPHKIPIDRTLEPAELLQIGLSQDTTQRYITMKRKRALESNPNTIYCPRQWCQGPSTTALSDKALSNLRARAENPGADPPPLPAPAERLAICTDCAFAFCLVCKASWHGEYVVCFPRSQFEITAEEKASEDYMLLHTQACPTCDARAQKTHGCNHMICARCESHFCYLCGSWIDKANPYQHFNTVKSSCYMRLWELEDGDDGEIGLGFAGGRDQANQQVVNFLEGDDNVNVDDGDSDGEAEPVPLDEVEDDWEPEPEEAHIVFRPRPPGMPRRDVYIERHGDDDDLADDGRPRFRGLGRLPGLRQHVRQRDRLGLERFLEMAREDNEDEWDSDEMSGDEAVAVEELEG